MNPHCELCFEKHHRTLREPPCDFCPYCDVEEDFQDIEEEVEQYGSCSK
jgi:hypothetical protein